MKKQQFYIAVTPWVKFQLAMLIHNIMAINCKVGVVCPLLSIVHLNISYGHIRDYKGTSNTKLATQKLIKMVTCGTLCDILKKGWDIL